MNQQQFTIRQGKPEDIPELQNLFVNSITAICNSSYNTQQIKAWTSAADNTQLWHQTIDTQYVLVAQHSNLIVGFATLHNQNHIDLLYTHKDFQHLGIASMLCTAIENKATRLHQTVLTCNSSITALPFFENQNFKVVKKQVVERNGIELVNYKMRKEIGGRK